MGDSFYNIFINISLLIDEMPSIEQASSEDSCLEKRRVLQTEIEGILMQERSLFGSNMDLLKGVLLNTPSDDRPFIIEEILRDIHSAVECAISKYSEINGENNRVEKAYINQFLTLASATMLQIYEIMEKMKISLSDVFISELRKNIDQYYYLSRNNEALSGLIEGLTAHYSATQDSNTTHPQAEVETPQEETKYTPELLKLFHNRRELIDELVGKSDKEIASKINKWAKETDKFGKLLIENPKNNLRSTFARELKKNGLIKCRVDVFSRKLS